MSRNRIGEYPGRGRNVRAGPDESSQRGSGEGDGQPEVPYSEGPDGEPSMRVLLQPRWIDHAGDGSSVVDGFDAELLRSCDVVLHRLEDIRGVPFPVLELARDQERVP